VWEDTRKPNALEESALADSVAMAKWTYHWHHFDYGVQMKVNLSCVATENKSLFL
jgi:hypothetical protein